MTRRYQKFGFRRDRNLSDAKDARESLANLINNLATAPGTTFVPEDLYAIEGIQNTSISPDDLRFLAGITETISVDNSEVTTLPIVTLKDRIDNFKVFTGSEIYGPGGDGPRAKFIPSDLITDPITSDMKGSDLYTEDIERVIRDVEFWDDGRFVFDSTIYPAFTDTYGMIQWEGYFSPTLYTIANNRITVQTTGFVLIESNLSDQPNEWVTHQALVSDSVEIEFTGDGNPASEIITSGFNLLAIGMNIASTEVTITDINIDTQTVTLSEPISTADGVNTATFEFLLGETPVIFTCDLPVSIPNDKIRIRYTAWWPDNSELMSRKEIQFELANLSQEFSFNLHYSSFDRFADIDQPESIEYFLSNRLGSLRENTVSDIINQNNTTITYSPPTTLADRILFNTPVAGSFLGVGKIEAANQFTDVQAGDWLLVRNPSEDPRAYRIINKRNNSVVFIDLGTDLSLGAALPYSFSFTIVKNQGLIGIYYIADGGIYSLAGLPFLLRRVIKDQLVFFIESPSTDAYRIMSYDQFGTGRPAAFNTLAGVEYIPANGLAVIYSDKGLVDLSKRAFCDGVVGATVSANVDVNATIIQLTDVDFSELATGMYVQLTGYILDTATIQSIDAVNSQIMISPSNAVFTPIPSGFSLTISPDSVNREICTIPNPNNTIPPFTGSTEGISTTNTNPGLWTNGIEIKSLNIELSDSGDINSVGVNTQYTKILPVKFGSTTYNLIAK